MRRTAFVRHPLSHFFALLVLFFWSASAYSQNSIFLTEGTLSDQSLSPAVWTVFVEPDAPVTGTVSVLAHNAHRPGAVVPFGYTWTWGPRESAIVTLAGDIAQGTHNFNVPINLTAPSATGTYYLLFALRGEFTMRQVFSATNWTVGSGTWHDGNDYHDLEENDLLLARTLGYVPNWPYLFTGGFVNIQIAVMPIKVVVTEESFLLDSIQPNKGGDAGSVSIVLFGRGFSEGSEVRLVQAGEDDIIGDPVNVESNTTITTTFDLTGKAPGLWDVVMENPDGTMFTLEEGFTIEEGSSARVWVDIIGRNVIRATRRQRYHLLYGNRGNIDAGTVNIWLLVSPKSTIVDPLFAPMVKAGVTTPNVEYASVYPGKEANIIPVSIRNIPPNFTGAISFDVTVQSAGSFEIKSLMVAP